MIATRTRRTLAIILACLAALPMVLTLLLGSIYGFTVCKPFYWHEYRQNNSLEVIETDEQSLDTMTDVVIGYLTHKRDNMDMRANVHGALQEVFTDRAKTHMADVLKLYDLLTLAVLICLPVMTVLILGAVFIAPDGKRLYALCRGLLIGITATLVLLVILALLIMRNFTEAFILFHHLFFTNDLWLLDASDVLIQMLPERFFMDIALYIGITFGVLLLIILTLCVIGLVKSKKKSANGEDRPGAEEIFQKMAISDDSAVPAQTKSLIGSGNDPIDVPKPDDNDAPVSDEEMSEMVEYMNQRFSDIQVLTVHAEESAANAQELSREIIFEGSFDAEPDEITDDPIDTDTAVSDEEPGYEESAALDHPFDAENEATAGMFSDENESAERETVLAEQIDSSSDDIDEQINQSGPVAEASVVEEKIPEKSNESASPLSDTAAEVPSFSQLRDRLLKL